MGGQLGPRATRELVGCGAGCDEGGEWRAGVLRRVLTPSMIVQNPVILQDLGLGEKYSGTENQNEIRSSSESEETCTSLYDGASQTRHHDIS